MGNPISYLLARRLRSQLRTSISYLLVRKPCLRGHRIGIHRVAGWWKLGLTTEEIGERLSSLTPAEIHVALAYYHLHRQEMESYLDEERAVCCGLERTPSARV